MPVLSETHPLVRYAANHDLERRQVATIFGVPWEVFRCIVTGHSGVSYHRAKEWQKKSKGEISAADVMEWHFKHARD